MDIFKMIRFGHKIQPFITFFIILFTLNSVFSTTYAQDNLWQLYKQNEQIKVWRSSEKTDGLATIKAELVVDSSLAGFLLFLQDTPNIPKWLDNAKHSEVIKQFSATDNLFITHFKGLFLVSARNMVIQSSYIQNYDKSIDIFVFDAGDKVKPVKGSVRVTVNHAHWFIKPLTEEQILVRYKFSVNPNGNVPNFMVNKVTLKSVWKTMNNLAAQLPNSNWQQQGLSHIKEYKVIPPSP